MGGGLRVRKPGGQPCSISEHLLGLMYALGSELGRGLKTHDLLEPVFLRCAKIVGSHCVPFHQRVVILLKSLLSFEPVSSSIKLVLRYT